MDYINNIGTSIDYSFMSTWNRVINYLPQLIGGLIILVIGLVIAGLLKSATLKALELLKVKDWFGRDRVDSVAGRRVWPEILGEVVRWTVIITFLIPAAEAWGLPQVTELLNRLLLYIPNVIVAVIIGFVGFGLANITRGFVQSATSRLGSSSANLLAQIASYAVTFFTVLIVLTQLGIAADLIKILFTGIVAMLALAGGLAFGLGGQDAARNALNQLRQKTQPLARKK